MRQAEWAEYLSHFKFTIQYCTGKSNDLANALSWQENVLKIQQLSHDEYQKQTLLSPNRVAEEVWQDTSQKTQIAVLDVEFILIDWVLQWNCEDSELEQYQEEAHRQNAGESPWSLSQGLLLHKDQLVVVKNDTEHLHTKILDEIHCQPMMAHPGHTKMWKLVMEHYYWPQMGTDINWYVANCHICKCTQPPWDLLPGLLKPLPIPD